MSSHILELDLSRDSQTGLESTFIGGLPKLPNDMAIPMCGLCGTEETFFFQLDFPAGLSWASKSLAVFACTNCAAEDYLIPQLLVPLENADIPEGFLEDYQINFHFRIFETQQGTLRRDYRERIAFHRWRMVSAEDNYNGNKIGGTPVWLLGDESPRSYAGRSGLQFLMQLLPDLKYPILSDAPPQVRVDFSGPPGAKRQSPNRYYELFLGNALYLFGLEEHGHNLIYAVVQSP